MKNNSVYKRILIVIVLLLTFQKYSYGQCPAPSRSFTLLDTKNDSLINSSDFDILDKYYAKTLEAVYFNHIRDIGSVTAVIKETYHIIKGADPETFLVMKNNNFSFDSISVYFHGYKIESADTKSFEPLNNHFSMDKNHIYQGTCIIEGADRETFKVEGENYYNYAYDKNYVYFYNDKAEIDVDSFERKWTNVCEDKYHSYTFVNHKIKKEKKAVSKNTTNIDSILITKNFKRETVYKPISLNYKGKSLLRPGQKIDSLNVNLAFQPNANGEFQDIHHLIKDYISLDNNLSIQLKQGSINGILTFSVDQNEDQIFNISGNWTIDTHITKNSKIEIVDSITKQLFPVLKEKLKFKENWKYENKNDHYTEYFMLNSPDKNRLFWNLDYQIKMN